MVRMVVGELRNSPNLAHIWHDDDVARVIGIVAGIMERARARGEGGGRRSALHAFSLMGRMVTTMLFRGVFGRVAIDPTYLQAFAGQPACTALRGL